MRMRASGGDPCSSFCSLHMQTSSKVRTIPHASNAFCAISPLIPRPGGRFQSLNNVNLCSGTPDRPAGTQSEAITGRKRLCPNRGVSSSSRSLHVSCACRRCPCSHNTACLFPVLLLSSLLSPLSLSYHPPPHLPYPLFINPHLHFCSHHENSSLPSPAEHIVTRLS